MVTGWPHLSNPADDIFFFIVWISVILLFLITSVMVYFVFRYSRKRHPEAQEVKDNVFLEVLWTVIPTILVIVIFFVGWKGFQYMRTAPADAMPVKVTARQWSWTFDYRNGRQESVLKVPVGKPVKLLMTSADVLHSLYIPAYRIKEDCVPGRETYLWFLPDETGSYDLFCTEYCGLSHANMITKVEVMSEQAFDSWYNGERKEEPDEEDGERDHEAVEASQGAKLLQVKGCVACHSVDGSKKVGPGFKGLFGKEEIVLRDGKEREILVNEAFIKEKLIHPEINRIKGFPPIMPSQEGQLNSAEIDAIIDYMKHLK
jgi:cytochrome c oxidase subunit 2